MNLQILRTKSLAYAVSLALSSATLAPSPTANAATAVYPGTICQSWGGNASLDHKFVEYSQFGRVLNSHSTKRLGVVCPIPRNHRTNNKIDRVEVYYNDRHPGVCKQEARLDPVCFTIGLFRSER